MTQFQRNERAYAQLRDLPPAPPGQTYVLTTLAYSSPGRTIATSQDALAWVREFVEGPEQRFTDVREKFVRDGSLPAEVSDLLDGLLARLAIAGPMPISHADDPMGLVLMRLRLVREHSLAIGERVENQREGFGLRGLN